MTEIMRPTEQSQKLSDAELVKEIVEAVPESGPNTTATGFYLGVLYQRLRCREATDARVDAAIRPTTTDADLEKQVLDTTVAAGHLLFAEEINKLADLAVAAAIRRQMPGPVGSAEREGLEDAALASVHSHKAVETGNATWATNIKLAEASLATPLPPAATEDKEQESIREYIRVVIGLAWQSNSKTAHVAPAKLACLLADSPDTVVGREFLLLKLGEAQRTRAEMIKIPTTTLVRYLFDLPAKFVPFDPIV